jgi:hypothetical protein
MTCRHCEDCIADAARVTRLACRFSGAEVTHDAELESTCPRTLTAYTEDNRCVARTVLAVTLLLDPRGALLVLLLSRYSEGQAARLRGLLRGEGTARAVHGRFDQGTPDTPRRWEERYGGALGVGELDAARDRQAAARV